MRKRRTNGREVGTFLSRGLLCGALLAGILLPGGLLSGCSPETHESVGPLVPVPNVTGRILRDGAEAEGIQVDLILVPADSTLASVETDDDGEYVFTDVGAGSLMIEAEGEENGDFEDLAYSFVFFSTDTMLQIPDLDISSAALQSLAPQDSAVVATPNLFNPVEFAWQWADEGDPLPRFRVRFYTMSGDQIWYSEKLRELEIPWNGIGSEGEFEGRPVGPGQYRWRLRVYGEDTREFTTDYRHIEFE